MVSDKTIHKAFRICKTLQAYTKPVRENLYFHYLPKLDIGFNMNIYMYRKSTSIRHFEQCNQQLSNLICQNCDGCFKCCWMQETSNMQCNYNSLIQIINFHRFFRNALSAEKLVPAEYWCPYGTTEFTFPSFICLSWDDCVMCSDFRSCS